MENNKQQTPVEWFFNQLVTNRIIVVNGSTYWDKVKTKYEILLEQAKEMEKLRIIKILAEQSTKEAARTKELLEFIKNQHNNETTKIQTKTSAPNKSF